MTTDCAIIDRLNKDDQKTTALDMILCAWDQALQKGCSPDTIATSAIFAALADLIDVYGEDVVAEMTSRLPQRITRGEFSMREGPAN
jgi:hypothetical protein